MDIISCIGSRADRPTSTTWSCSGACCRRGLTRLRGLGSRSELGSREDFLFRAEGASAEPSRRRRWLVKPVTRVSAVLDCAAGRRLTNCFIFFFFNDTATTEIYTLSLHDALPI